MALTISSKIAELASKAEAIPDKEPKGKNNSDVGKLESWLRRQYDFRFNEIKQRAEVREKGLPEFAPLDDYKLNSIVRAGKLKQLKLASKSMIDTVINSSFARKVNPLQQYFESLEPGTPGAIKELCETITPVAGQEMLQKYFSKWLVGAIANVFDEKMCRNHICFILNGPQGIYKSTWIRQLCPKQLDGYYFEGNLDPENKDDLIATAENFIYNMDDYFAAVTKKKINEFKSFLTKNSVKCRTPYGRYPKDRPKVCSFIASSNEEDFLHDPTGNRRFVPFEIEGIDIDAAKEIDINEVWAEAFQLWQSDFEYWVNKEDQKELAEHNAQYEVQSTEYEALITYFQLPENHMEAEAYLQNTKIRKKLEDETGIKMSPKRLGEALRKAGFIRISRRVNGNPAKVYAVDYTEVIDVDADEGRAEEKASKEKEEPPF